jgi:hypothetical protein
VIRSDSEVLGKEQGNHAEFGLHEPEPFSMQSEKAFEGVLLWSQSSGSKVLAGTMGFKRMRRFKIQLMNAKSLPML